jgi:uncharacterized membrane protein
MDSFKTILLHLIFKISILIKGLDGVLEMIGGLLLLAVSQIRLNQLIILLTQHELIEDPQDLVANFLVNLAHDLSVSAIFFASLYLLSHGVVKVILVASLWRGKLWAYPTAIIFFFIFIIYQLYRYNLTGAGWLIWLTIFDFLVVLLTWREYQHLKNNLNKNL